MADNSYTKTYADGQLITEAQLDTAYKSLKPALDNTTNLTSGSTSGTFLKSNGDGAAASWASIPDPLGPFALRNYGLAASASGGALTIALKNNAGSDATSSDKVNLTFSNNGSASATYTAVDVTAALSITVNASATLGFTGTSANRVFIYAINNSGTPRLAVSRRSDFDLGTTISTTSISAAADDGNSVYATASLSVVARLLGWVDAALNSGKQWQSPSRVAVVNQPNADSIGIGMGATGANAVLAETTSCTSSVANLIAQAMTATGADAVVRTSGVGDLASDTGSIAFGSVPSSPSYQNVCSDTIDAAGTYLVTGQCTVIFRDNGSLSSSSPTIGEVEVRLYNETTTTVVGQARRTGSGSSAYLTGPTLTDIYVTYPISITTAASFATSDVLRMQVTKTSAPTSNIDVQIADGYLQTICLFKSA